MFWDDIVGSVEADDERQLQRLARSSSTDTEVPCPGDIDGPSEQDPFRDVQPVQLSMQ